ncbi:MAG: acyl-CoA dehydrogenase family protein [Candidatus Bathyarchaeia archaeon]
MYELFDLKKKYVKAIVSDEEIEIAKAIREFVNKEIMPRRKDLEGGWHRDEKLARETFKSLAHGLVKLGCQKCFLPREWGGDGISGTAWNLITAEIARGDLGLAMHFGILALSMMPAMLARRKDLFYKFGDKLLEDKPCTACVAITEHVGGANIEDLVQQGKAITTTARLDGNEWVINGAKIWPSGAGVADLCYVIICTVDPTKGDEGIALIYVPPDAKGVSFGKPIKKMGMSWTSINAEIFLENVRVPKEYRVAEPGEDAKILRDMIAYARLNTAANVTALAETVLEIVLDYTKDRRIIKKPVREYSLFAHILGDMTIAVETSRAYWLQVSWMFDHPEIYGRPGETANLARATAAKAYACDVAVGVTNKAMELMGSYGYSFELHIEKYLRDVKTAQLWLGGPQRERLDVALSHYSFKW